MNSSNSNGWRFDPADSIAELQAFLGSAAGALRTQVDASSILAAPRLTSLRERLGEIAEELDCLRAAMEPPRD